MALTKIDKKSCLLLSCLKGKERAKNLSRLVKEVRKRGANIENKGWLRQHFRVLPNDICQEGLEIKLIIWALLADFWRNDASFLEELELLWGDNQPSLPIEASLQILLENKMPKLKQVAMELLVGSYNDAPSLFEVLRAQNKTDPKGWVKQRWFSTI
jgi:hypothetical protein